MDRRDFLCKGLMLCSAPFVITQSRVLHAADAKSPLVLAYEAGAASLSMHTGSRTRVASFQINPDAIQRMVDAAVKRITRQASVAAAWESLFGTTLTNDSKILLKINLSYGWSDEENDWTRQTCPFGANAAVIDAVINGLTQMQDGTFPVENITVFDLSASIRSNVASMTRQGFRSYTVPQSGVYDDRTRGSYRIWLVNNKNQDEIRQVDPDFIAAPSFSQEYQAPQRFLPPLMEHDFMINIASAKDHRSAGVTGALKNTYGCTDNCYGTHGDQWTRLDTPYPGTQRCVPVFCQKCTAQCPIVLNILDALAGIYDKGPTLGPVFSENIIAMSKDPVTLDYYLLEMVNTHRKTAGMPLLTTDTGRASDQHPHAPSLAVAANEYSLGNLNSGSREFLEVTGVRPFAACPSLAGTQSRLSGLYRNGAFFRIGLLLDHSGRQRQIQSFITTPGGRMVRQAPLQHTRRCRVELEWNGLDDRDRRVARGTYVWNVRVEKRLHHRVFTIP